jgi:hypothetical protein
MSYTARITYDTDNNIDFKIRPSGEMITSRHERNINRAGSGLPEFINLYGDTLIEVDAFFDESTYRDLMTFFWSWARNGKYFSFAVDNTDTVLTTLDSDAAADQAVIPLTSTTGLSTGDVCIIIDISSGKREIVVIDSISAGVSVTADADLKFSFSSGDIFRHFNYFPYVYLDDTDFNPQRTGVLDTTSQLYRTYRFKFVEAFTAGYFDTEEGVLEL